MYKVRNSSLVMSFSILLISWVGGWLMTVKTGDAVAAREFMKFGGVFALVIFMGKIIIFAKAKKFLFYQILFIGGMGIDLAWFLSCFFLPLLWTDKIGTTEKLAIVAFYLTICVFNVQFAGKSFVAKWEAVGKAKFEKIFDARAETVDWASISKSMGFVAVICVPGVSKKYEDLISFLMLLLLILGITLRSNYPACSMIALSIPFSICAACCLQMSRYHFSGAQVIRLIEIKKNIKLKSAD